MSLKSLGRLWRTVRHLRAEQWLGRLWKHAVRPQPDLRAAPPLRRRATTAWIEPAARAPSLRGAQTFDFLGLQHTLPPGAAAWNDHKFTHLWRYNLHYFDDLNANGAASRHNAHESLIERWIAENPPGSGTGWEPYPTSLRIVNWVKWTLGGAELQPAWRHSLAVQTRWLRQRLEWHLLGNHLFCNAKALVAAGLLFDGAEANGWLHRGVQLLQRELPEQILSDGGHFERSPMYHALALEDLLDLLNLLAAFKGNTQGAEALEAPLRQHATAMLRWLRCMRHPDGTLVRFNDNAEGIAPPIADIERYAEALGISAAATAPGDGLHLLADSGYLHAECGAAVAWLDVAPIGPDYLPGHAHADTLSFELSLGGRQLIVNRGTSEYGTGPRRLAERGTALHSTVQLGAHDSSEVWSGFRVGRRARPGPVHIDSASVESSHDGYAHLPGAPQHHRRWLFEANGLVVEDRLRPAVKAAATARYHLAPGLELAADGDNRWRVLEGGRTLARAHVEQGRGATCNTLHAQRFGVLVSAATLEVQLHAGECRVRWHWNP